MRLLLERMNVEIVSEAATGEAAVAEAQRLAGVRASEWNEGGPLMIQTPDLVLCSARLPDRNGIHVMRDVLGLFFGVRAIALVDAGDVTGEVVSAVFGAGAMGLVTLMGTPDELRLAVHAVACGERYVDPAAAVLMTDVIRRDDYQPPVEEPYRDLTRRQREVLTLTAMGLPRRAIAKQLGIHVKTVDTYRATIAERTGIPDLAGLTLYAARHGLIAPSGAQAGPLAGQGG
jgi:two-component system response regulator NreC